MPNTKKINPHNILLYLTYNLSYKNRAISINTNRRKKILQKLGFNVLLFSHEHSHALRDFLRLLFLLPKIHCLYIRIDGSCTTEEFTLLKLLKWSLPIVWEIHGFPEENLSNTDRKSYQIKGNLIKRRLLSHFANRYIFISEALRIYAHNKLAWKKQYVIHNFIENKTPKETNVKLNSPLIEIINDADKFKIMWSGNAHHYWHGLDIIQNVARKIYKIDASIHFILIGFSPHCKLSWQKNITIVNELSRNKTLSILDKAHLCLALYRNNISIPLYFSPLKILDYMSLKKPIIATSRDALLEILTNGYDSILTSNSVKDIVQKILWLKHHTKARYILGEHAFQTLSRRFTMRQTAKLYRIAMRDLLC